MLHIYTNQFYNETINYAIYSYEGKLMQTNSLNPQILKNTIAISNLSAGVYTIHFSQKTGAHTTKKIVVIK